MVKNLPANAGDLRSIPGSGRSSGEGNRHSCLENSMDRGAWRATVHGVTKVGVHASFWIRVFSRYYWLKGKGRNKLGDWD